MGRQMRLLWLTSVARWRQLGVAPWLFLLAWMLWTVQQEPQLLRDHGIRLVDGAGWWGVGLLWVGFVLADPGNRAGVAAGLIANWAALLGAAVLLAAILWSADLATASWRPSSPVRGGCQFLLAGAGLACALAGRNGSHLLLFGVVVAVQVVVFASLATADLNANTAAAATTAALAGSAISVLIYARK
jgi:hypothetical protein